MTEVILPERLVVFPSKGNNAMTLTSIMNAIHYPKIKNNVKSVLLLYDESVKKTTDFDYLKKMLKPTKLIVEELQIPEINDLISKNLNYKIKDGDCILVPALQLHLAMVLHHVSTEVSSVVPPNNAYICFTKPQGNLVRWISVSKSENGGLITEDSEHELPFKSSIDWYFESVQNHTFPNLKILGSVLEQIIKSESETVDLDEWIKSNDLVKITGCKSSENIGFGFEELAAATIEKNHSIHQVVMNVKFASELKGLAPRREEDIIAIHKNGNMLFISCKFNWCKNVEKARDRLNLEIERMKNLKLPFNIPDQRISRILVTTSMASKLVESTEDVYVTNLDGLTPIIENL